MSTDEEPSIEATVDEHDTAEDEDASAPEYPALAAAGPPRRSRRRTVVIAGLSAGYLLVFGAAGGLGWQLWQQHRVDAAADAAQHAAVAYAQVLTSIDSDHVDDNFDAVLNGATGEFKDTYTKASVGLRQLLIDNKASAQGTVVASAVQSESTDQVVVLLMVDQTVSNTARPDPRVDRSRMKMTMQKIDGRWLASKVELP